MIVGSVALHDSVVAFSEMWTQLFGEVCFLVSLVCVEDLCEENTGRTVVVLLGHLSLAARQVQ